MRIYTIGFTNKPAQTFFGQLRESGATSLLDVRLNNTSQLAGFTKKDDLGYFLDALCGMEYVHEPLLAPTKEILDDYMEHGTGWGTYQERFLVLMRERHIEKKVDPALVENAVLMCSEEQPLHCHRRLVADYLQAHWIDVEIHHLV